MPAVQLEKLCKSRAESKTAFQIVHSNFDSIANVFAFHIHAAKFGFKTGNLRSYHS